MDIVTLRKNEKELREKFGDEFYEKMYMRYSRAETRPAVNTRADRPQVKSGGGQANRPAISEYRNNIAALNSRIENLNKQQYHAMLTGDDRKTAAYDGVIKSVEQQRDMLKKQMNRALGLSEESEDADTLSAAGKFETEAKPVKPAGNIYGRPAEPISSGEGNDGDDEEKLPPDPLIDDNVYVSEDDYKSLMAGLDKELEDRYAASGTGPVQTAIDINMQRTKLSQNRELSKSVEETQGMYDSEENAAVAFAEKEVPETGKDWLERGAIITGRKVPVITTDGKIEMQMRYELGDTFIGNHSDVVSGVLTAYTDAAGDMRDGATISFVHTHPYCTGHNANDFSGVEGDSVWTIAGQAADRIIGGKGFDDFANYLGDMQVTWLPGVDKMYLASPTEQSLYACDDNGPILDPNDSTKYKVISKFNAKVSGPPHQD